MADETKRKPKLEEAARRWGGKVVVLQGDPRQFTPAPAVGAAHEVRRAA